MHTLVRIVLAVHPYLVLCLPLLAGGLIVLLLLPDLRDFLVRSGGGRHGLHLSPVWGAPAIMIAAGLLLLCIPPEHEPESGWATTVPVTIVTAPAGPAVALAAAEPGECRPGTAQPPRCPPVSRGEKRASP